MENGYVILSIIALLFLSMYGYVYAGIAIAKMKEKRALKREVVNEELKMQEKLRKQEVRDEKVRLATKRREEIQLELKMLEKQRLDQGKLHKMRVEQMKKKNVS